MKKRLIALALSVAIMATAFCLSPVVQAAVTDKTETSAGTVTSASDFSWDNASVYFLLTDRFKNGKTSNDHAYKRNLDQNGQPAYGRSNAGAFHGGDFAGITEKINDGYFTDLGVNALWITAPYEQIHGYVLAGSGKTGTFPHYSYHGYYAADFSEVDQAYGTEKEFETMVDSAHKKGIRIVLDVVMNHVGYNTLVDMEEYGFGKLKNSNWKTEYYKHTINDSNTQGYHASIDYGDSNWANWWGPQWIRAGLGGGYSEGGGDDLTRQLAYLPDVKTENGATVDIPPYLKTKWTKEGSLSKKQSELDNYFSKNSKSKTVRNYLVFWLTQWVEKYGVDGFRCDTAKHVEMASWKALKEQGLKSLKTWRANNPTKPGADWDEDFWMTGECFPHGVSYDGFYTEGGFDSMINFSFCGNGSFDASSGGVPGSGSINNVYSDYANSVNKNDKFNILSYISSHDTALCRQGDKNIYQGSAFQLLPGGIQIYYGDETNRPLANAFEDHNLRSDMNWSSYDKNTLSHWQKVGQFRNKHVCVGAGSHTNLSATSGTAFARTYSKNGVNDKIAAVIAAGANSNVTINLNNTFADGTVVKNYYDGKTATVSGGKVTFNSGSNGTILVESASGDEPQPVTEASTSASTSASETPTTPTPSSGLYGDANGDNIISIKDATAIQKHVADIEHIKPERLGLSDVNGDKSVNIKDATAIQKYLAQLTHNSKTGQPYQGSQPATVAPDTQQVQTEPETQSASEETPVSGTRVYFDNSDNWVTPYVYYWPEGSGGPVQWPGEAMTKDKEGRWTYVIPEGMNHCIFSNDGNNQTENLDVPSSSGMTFSYSSRSWS